MNHQDNAFVSRSGYVGGTLTSLLLAIRMPDLTNAIILACVVAVTSFCTVKVLNYLFGKIKKHQP